MPTISNVNVLDLYGDSFLDHAGIGTATMGPNGSVTQVQCGVFAVIKPIPVVGKEYIITGDFDQDPKIPFKVTMRCTVAARPASIFQ